MPEKNIIAVGHREPGRSVSPDINARIVRNRRAFAKRLQFEQLIADCATRFINVPPDRIVLEIENILRIIAEFFRVDRSTIFSVSGRPQTLKPLHSYTSAGIDPIAELNAEALYPWCWEKLLRGEMIAVSSPEELPAEAAVDLETISRLGLLSFIGVPVRIQHQLKYVFTLTCLKRPRRWAPHLVSRISLVGNLLGNALNRKQTDFNLTRLAVEIQQFRKSLAHQDRIGTVGALTAAIAHEINQPLAAILSNAQAAIYLLDRQKPDMEEIRSILLDIITADNRASDVIRNIRRLLKKDERHYECCDANGLVAQVVQLTAGDALLRQTEITTDLAPHLRPVYGDPILLQQVIMNLVTNAMDAMGTGRQQSEPGRITIRTRIDETDGVSVSVCDTGPGISEPLKSAVLKPFSSTKTSGLGIGLILCQSIIEAHGGSMAFENQPAGGARVSFRLPAIRPDPSHGKSPEAGAGHPAASEPSRTFPGGSGL